MAALGVIGALVAAAISLPAAAQDGAEFCVLGKRVTSAHPGDDVTLVDPGTDVVFGWADEDGDGDLDWGEPVYLEVDVRTRISSDDVRWTPYGDRPAGTRPVQGDEDIGGTLTELVNGQLAYHDANGNDAVDPDERIYVDGDGSSTVDVGDVILHPQSEAGTQTQPSPAVGDQLDDLLGKIMFWDRNDDGHLNSNETVFFDLDDSGALSPGDVCLSNEEEPEPEPEPTVDPTPTDDPTPTTDPTDSTDGTDTTDDTDGTTGPRTIPALPFAALAGAAAAGLLLVRRRD